MAVEKLSKAADKILSVLPFNGNKTLVGVGLKCVVPLFAAKFPFLILLAPVLDSFADFLVSVGLTHKAVKGVNARVEGRKEARRVEKEEIAEEEEEANS